MIDKFIMEKFKTMNIPSFASNKSTFLELESHKDSIMNADGIIIVLII